MRLLIKLLTKLAVLGIFLTTPVMVYAADTYPYSNATTCQTACQVDPWSFYKRECTSYAAWKVNEAGITFYNTMTGPNGSAGRFGSAGNWDNNAVSIGYVVDSSPSAGAIAVWDPNTNGAGAAGHVGYVDIVNGPNITISEYNWYPAYVYNTRTFISSASDAAQFYIHLSGSTSCPIGSDITFSSVISSGTSLTCSATSSITMQPGFNAVSGSEVRFYIQ
ncbi:CHAP domain-containing protein [Candidatus Dojkabacteria bacterium]|uniref:CHAP domain-containing protein n=1 Tax=Candidatus Dojkabacteria bacterium TaxID=2099670 RepID=A0A955KZB7_9BACT|nr:CHAP domain-containing protein [Candidatus Dojkabacteria bacterium]